LNFYTNNEEVQAVNKKAWYVLVAFVFFDCMQGVSAGNIAGLGLMSKVKWVTVFDYWVLGIPLSYYLMMKKDMGIEGLWYGPTLACLMNYIFYEITIKSADWEQISIDINEKMDAQKAKMDDAKK